MLSGLLALALACNQGSAPTARPEELAATATATVTPTQTPTATVQPPLATPTPAPTLDVRTETEFSARPAVKPVLPETYYTPPVGFVSEAFKKTVGQTTVAGRLLRPASPRGAVVLVPTWWGMDKAIFDEAVQIAHWNYATLIVDFYDGKKPADRAEAAALTRGLDQARSVGTLKAAVAALADLHTTEPLPVAVVGYEWGATLALRLTLEDHAPKALAVIDPQPPADPAALKQIACPTLAIFNMHGGMVTKEEVDGFVAGLKLNGIKNPPTLRFTTAPGAMLKPVSLAEQAYAKTANEQLREFLAKMR